MPSTPDTTQRPGHASASAGAPSAEQREASLLGWCAAAQSMLIGYSGGVDSTYLASVALEALGRERVLAVLGISASLPASQREQAVAAAHAMALPLEQLPTHELDDAGYVANAGDRCFFCKGELWGRLAPLAVARGLQVVVDGTNADDLLGHRPGARAATERGVRSPLAELGFTKSEIRARSRARGLPTWDQPAAPCLASRLPVGTAVTLERLTRVEAAEAAVRGLGVTGDLRVRDVADVARIELAEVWIGRVRQEPALAAALRAAMVDAGFQGAELDLRGFASGRVSTSAAVSAPVLALDAMAS